jgi:hypothetical protein
LDVVAALNELADRGLIERSPDPDDGRRNITITPASRSDPGMAGSPPHRAGNALPGGGDAVGWDVEVDNRWIQA